MSMMNFRTENCEVSFSVEELTFKNLKVEKSKLETCKSKSELFRKLYDAGMEVCEIARECKSHYSFVYGVIDSSRGEVRNIKTASSSDEIRKLCDEGKTPGEIAKALNKNYSFVFSVCKKHKASKVQAV